MSLTVVLQGPVYSWTSSFARRYSELPSVSQVIVSTWEDDVIDIDPRYQIVRSKKPDNPGKGNRNYQIVSSQAGLRKVETDTCVRVRSDIFLPNFEEMLSFYQRHYDESQVYVLSVYPRFAFHPRDYVFWGETYYVKRVFEIPLDPESGPYDEWNDVRAESYIGAYYYSLFDAEIRKYLRNPRGYLTDKSPAREEVLKSYHTLLKYKIGFVPFPPFEIQIPKHYPAGYPFDRLRDLYGEVYHGDEFLAGEAPPLDFLSASPYNQRRLLFGEWGSLA